MDKEELSEKYKAYVLETEGAASSVYRFTKNIGLEEADFYDYFPSMPALRGYVFAALLREVVESLEEDETFLSYMGREKLLALYFTFFESLKGDRSFLLAALKPDSVFDAGDASLAQAQNVFDAFWKNIFLEAKESGEIVERKFVEQTYGSVLWRHFIYLLNYWLHDTSEAFSKTDVAVEKSVNAMMDLIGNNFIDSVWDWGFYLLKDNFKKFAGFDY